MGVALRSHSEKKIQSKFPTNGMTCLEVKAFLEKKTGCSSGFTLCCQCGSFELEKFDNFGLRLLKDNNPIAAGNTPIPKRFLCRTWWISERNCHEAFKVTPPSYLSSLTLTQEISSN